MKKLQTNYSNLLFQISKMCSILGIISITSIISSGELSAQNIGINNTTPNAPLSFANSTGSKIDLSYTSSTSRFGIGLQGLIMQIYSSGPTADIAFGYGAVGSFTEMMRIKGNGSVGIGNGNPSYILDVKSSFSSLLRLENSSPLANLVHTDMFFKTGDYFTGAIKSTGTSASEARLGLLTGASLSTGDLAERISILNNGFVGIGTALPTYKLDVAGRARLRHEGGAVTAGLWFNDSNNIEYTFAGMKSDSVWGLYASGYKFNFDMDNARLGIGIVTPQYPLVFTHTLGDKISLYGGGGLPNADHYGFGIQGSLMQLFTPTSTSDIVFGYGRSAAFTERVRIKGNGFVGIGTSTPGYILDVNGRMRIKYNNGLPAGLWLTDSANNDEALFGMFGDQIVGFYSSAVGWNLVMNTSNGRVGVGTSSPFYPLDVTTDSEPVAGRFVNSYVTGTTSGISGLATAAPSGRGVVGSGRKTGVEAYADIAGSGDRYGLDSWGKNGTTNNYGARCEGLGGAVAYGIYAKGSGGTVNYGGYFVGDVYTNGAYLPSDRKLKSEILPLNHALSIINQLKPSEYTYKTNEYKQMQLPEGVQYGLIADEVIQVLPRAVKKAFQPAEYENHENVNGRKLSDEVEFNAVNYTVIIPILIGAVQEQQVIITDQEKKIEELESRLVALEKKFQ